MEIAGKIVGDCFKYLLGIELEKVHIALVE